MERAWPHTIKRVYSVNPLFVIHDEPLTFYWILRYVTRVCVPVRT